MFSRGVGEQSTYTSKDRRHVQSNMPFSYERENEKCPTEIPPTNVTSGLLHIFVSYTLYIYTWKKVLQCQSYLSTLICF